MTCTPTIKMSLHLSMENNSTLERLCSENNLTKSGFLRRAISLMEVFLTSKKKGNRLIVVDKDELKVCDVS